MDTDSKSTILIEVEQSLIPKDIGLEAHVNRTVFEHFGFNLGFNKIQENNSSRLTKAQISLCNIPPLASMQHHYKGSLFNDIENILIELTANGLGDLNNGRNGTMTASEIDNLIKSGLSTNNGKHSLLVIAVLEAIFDVVIGVNFVKNDMAAAKPN